MTLSDRQYQQMRDEAKAVIRKVGVDTGGSNIQFAVEPADRPAGRDRDEPARVALLGARVEGHGVPDREDRGPPRGGLPAGRDPQRHHEEDARLFRAVARLRGRQDPALDLREIPEGRSAPDHPDEIRGRGDGHRPHLHGGPGQGDPLAGDRARRPRRRRPAAAAGTAAREALGPRPGSGSSTCAARSSPACRSRRSRRGPRSTLGSWTRSPGWSQGRGLLREEKSARSRAASGSRPRGWDCPTGLSPASS